MLIDFEAIRAGKTTYADMVSTITPADLRTQTNALFETIQAIIKDITDTTVTFVPKDPQSSEGDERGWTLGHVIVHLTATLEEGAAAAAMLARGVAVEARLRYEVPWETIQTAQQIHARLNESRRMCNAFLDAWPDAPDLTITITRIPFLGPMNSIGCYILGLSHGLGHLDQLREIIRQAQAL